MLLSKANSVKTSPFSHTILKLQSIFDAIVFATFPPLSIKIKPVDCSSFEVLIILTSNDSVKK